MKRQFTVSFVDEGDFLEWRCGFFSSLIDLTPNTSRKKVLVSDLFSSAINVWNCNYNTLENSVLFPRASERTLHITDAS